MSKSKGNVVTPAAMIDQHGAGAVRYWACRAAPGVDTAVDETQMRIGRRLAVKLLNASKFVLGLGADLGAGTAPGTAMVSVTAPIDPAMLGRFGRCHPRRHRGPRGTADRPAALRAAADDVRAAGAVQE